VERTQKTDLDEFYNHMDLQDPKLEIRLEKRQFQFNRHRSHGARNGKTGLDKVCEPADRTLLSEDVEKLYDETKEGFKEQN